MLINTMTQEQQLEQMALIADNFFRLQKIEMTIKCLIANTDSLKLTSSKKKIQNMSAKEAWAGEVGTFNETLGGLKRILQRHVLIAGIFDSKFDKFVADRNLFIHDYVRVFDSKGKCNEGLAFLRDLNEQARHWLCCLEEWVSLLLVTHSPNGEISTEMKEKASRFEEKLNQQGQYLASCLDEFTAFINIINGNFTDGVPPETNEKALRFLEKVKNGGANYIGQIINFVLSKAQEKS